MNIKSGYLQTLGNTKACEVFMETISSLPPNHLNYTLKIINKYFSLCTSIKSNPFKQYILQLAYTDTLQSASKYLTSTKQKTYLINVLKTKRKLELRKIKLDKKK